MRRHIQKGILDLSDLTTDHVDEPGVPKDVKRYADGLPMIAVRPLSPTQTLMLAKIALKHDDKDALDQACSGPMTMLGYVVERGGKILAVDERVGSSVEIQPGDVFISPEELPDLPS